MEISVSYVDGDCQRLASDGGFDESLSFHLEVRHHHVPFQCGQVDYWTKVLSSSAPGTAGCRTREMSCCWLSLWPPWTAGHPRPAGDPGNCSRRGNWYTGGWAEVIVERNAHPFLDSVGGLTGAQQISPLWGKVCQASPHLHPINAGRLRKLQQLPWPSYVVLEGSVPGCPAGTCTKGLILGNGPLNSRSRRRTQTLKHWSPGLLVLLGWGSLLCAGLGCLLGFLDATMRSACRMVRTLCCRTLGSGPRMWDPSKGAVLTALWTCGWKLKFLSKVSCHNSWRLEAAAKPAETAATWASWMMASFSSSSLGRWSLGDSSSITDATMEFAKEA